MSFVWIYENEESERLGSSEQFDSRDDAETWLGVNYEALLDEDVDQVRLLEDGVEVVEAMSLHP